MECGSHRGIKLLEHAVKILERVLEARLRYQVEIENMQFGFTPGKSTTDSIFIWSQLQEKFYPRNGNFAFLWTLKRRLSEFPERSCGGH